MCERERVFVKKSPESLHKGIFVATVCEPSREALKPEVLFHLLHFSWQPCQARRNYIFYNTPTLPLFFLSASFTPPPPTPHPRLLPPPYLLHTNSPSPSTFSLSLSLCVFFTYPLSSSSSTGESYLLLLEAFCKEEGVCFLCGECTLACSNALLRRHRHANVWPCFRPLHYQQRVHCALVLKEMVAFGVLMFGF